MPGRFLLTCAAAMHWPMFLKPVQASAAPSLSPVKVTILPVTILPPITGFFEKTSLIFCDEVGVVVAEEVLWSEPWPMEFPISLPIPPA
jgi:hypothetical protein